MIIVDEPEAGDDFELRITLVPHRSMNWQQNKQIIYALGSVCIGIALAFTLALGTWLFLPFAGLEVLALTTGLYYVSWKLSYRHIITVTEREIRIDKGVYRPRKSWRLGRDQTRLEIRPAAHEWEARKLLLNSAAESVAIGAFMLPDDAEMAISLLSPIIPRAIKYQ